jgi:ABC-type sugar transport system permease subunit
MALRLPVTTAGGDARRARRLWLFITPTIAVIGVAIVAPALLGAAQSLLRIDVIGSTPEFVGLDNYLNLFGDSRFVNSLSRSFLFVTGVVAGGQALGLLFAWTLFNFRRTRRLVRALVLLPYLIGGVPAAIIWRFMFSGDRGFINQALGAAGVPDPPGWLSHPDLALLAVLVSFTWIILPLSTLILLGGLLSIDPQVSEAARVDGASAWEEFRRSACR